MHTRPATRFLVPALLFQLGCGSSGNAVPSDAGPSNDATTADGGMPGDSGTQAVVDGAADARADAPSDGGAEEAGADAGADAPANVPDGGSRDAGDDAGPPAVTVHVVSKLGQPMQGVQVVFSDVSGAFLLSNGTDANGDASGEVPSGSQATVLFPGHQMLTFVAVDPGDTLTAVDNFDFTYFEAKLTAVPPSPPPGTVSYSAYAGNCGASGFTTFPQTIPLDYGGFHCVSAQGYSLLVVASDSASNAIGYALQKGYSIPADGGVASVSVDGPWSASYGSQTLSATSTATIDATLAQFTLFEVSSGTRADANPLTNNPVVVDGGAAQSFATYTGYADFLEGMAIYASTPTNSQYLVTRPPSSSAGDISFDLARLLPDVAPATLDTTTPARPAVSWTLATSPSNLDGIFVQVAWMTNPDSARPTRGLWSAIVPPTATSVQVPVLPASASAWAPGPDASYSAASSSPAVVTADADWLSGYAAFRPMATTIFPETGASGASAENGPVLPAAGTLRMSIYAGNHP